MTDDTMNWTQEQPGQWRSADGAYVVLRSVLPEPRDALAVIYTLRWTSPTWPAVPR